jgi:hypothetical protein
MKNRRPTGMGLRYLPRLLEKRDEFVTMDVWSSSGMPAKPRRICASTGFHSLEPMKTKKHKTNDDLRPEYDLRQLLKGGVRRKYAKRYHAGTNLVLLDPDVRKAFPTERAVNRANGW